MHISFKTLTLRATWLKIHLYIALLLGLFFALLGLSGSLSIYSTELDMLLNPQLRVAESTATPQSLDNIIAAIKTAHPKRYGMWTLEMPQHQQGMITAWFEKPQETFFEFHAPLMVSINPYTAEIIANRFWGQTFTTWVLDWHTQLRMDAFGWNTVGFIGIALLLSISSGCYLWWTGLNGLVNSFTLRFKAGQKTLLLDCHRHIGLIAAIPLLILTFTGISLSYPQILAAFTSSSVMNHSETGQDIVSTAQPTKHPTTLAGAVFIARSAFPKAQLRRITTPLGDTGVYRINFRQSDEINHRHPYTTVWIDHWSGQIKVIRDPLSFSNSETLSTWVWPLHTGEALGGIGRFIWFLAGIALFILYITGLWIWLLRRGTLQDKPVNLMSIKTIGYHFISFIKRAKTILAQHVLPWFLPLLEKFLHSVYFFLNKYTHQQALNNYWSTLQRLLKKHLK